MTRMVSQILWEHCMGELGIDGNNYENDTFAVRSYDWVDEDNNEWHFWHKPSGLKVQWYKYPLRGFEANMDIADDQFLDVLRDCTNSTEVGKDFKILHEVRKWWDEPQTNKDFKVTYTCSFTDCDNFKNFGFGEKCIECKRKQSEAKYKDEPQTDCGDFANRLAYERGVKHAWGVAQKVFDSTVTFYEAEDMAKQIDKDINVRSKDEPQTEPSFTATDFGKGTITRYTDEPQTCGTCKHMGDYEYCRDCCDYDLYLEAQTDCAWK